MKIAVCISGGIDSFYALNWAISRYENVCAVFLNLINDANQIKSVRKIASNLKVPLEIYDCSNLFYERIISYFVNEYKSGRTPNPCMFCNAIFKFEYVLSKGYDKVITGHYAKIEDGFIVKGKDVSKEQSYFLARVNKELLPMIELPLGNYTKDEIKREIGSLYSKKESQEVCFIKDGDYKSFLIKAGAVKPKKGKILNSKGKLIGFHEGYFNFTVGQRKGLNVSMGVPYYVLKIDAKNNIIYAGPKEETVNKKFSFSNDLWYDSPERYRDLQVKVRYRTSLKRCKIDLEKKMVYLIEPESSITPGQIAVFYSKNRVVGSGVIESAC